MRPVNFFNPISIKIEADSVYNDAIVSFKKSTHGVDLVIKAEKSLISHIYISYALHIPKDSLIFGDSVERGYGDMRWEEVNPSRQMYWDFMVANRSLREVYGLGVLVQPNSFVSFKVDDEVVTIDINVLSGGDGVNLAGRELHACTFVQFNETYRSVYESARTFMKLLMGDTKMLEAKEPVYGFNNWYYAYGVSSYKQIIDDTKLLSELTLRNKNRPFMVVDDGWSLATCSGPWYANNDYVDMGKLASEIKSLGVKPGLWFRPLCNKDVKVQEFTHPLNKEMLDPTRKEVKELIYNDVKRFVDWGYELIKFDYITYDLFLHYGVNMPEEMTHRGWHYSDNHFTNAEILLDIYRLIRKAAGDKAILIGCNTISHLSAGICELNRVGDDTSGKEWERTRKMGVNSLAFRLMQNGIFYKIDADCVGIMGLIDWKQNKEWLDVLARSGSPLFVSCDPYIVTDEIKKDLKKAFKLNEKQEQNCRPTDWLDKILPEEWSVDGETFTYNWFKSGEEK